MSDLFKRGNSVLKAVLVPIPISRSIFELSQELKHEFGNSSYLRLHLDDNEEECVLVYDYYQDNLLSLVRNNPDLPIKARKFILRELGLGLRDLHSTQWIHLGAIC